MPHDYIQSNFAFVVAFVFLVLFICLYRTFDRKITQLFTWAVMFTLLLFVVENLSVWSSELPHPTFIRRLTSALGYGIRPLIILMLILIVYRGKIKNKVLLFIPTCINICVSFTGLFCGVAFYFTEDNDFCRGPLGYLPHITAGFYLVVLLVATVGFIKGKYYEEGIIIGIIEVANVLATILESVWRYKGLLRTAIVLSLAFYYIFFQTQSTKRDSLTGALTRRYFYIDAERMKGKLQAVISMDLNNLKVINDTLGHAEGDKAIMTFVECVHKAMQSGFTLYRTGGDEFTMLCCKCNEEQVKSFVENLKDRMQKTPYTCAVGIAFWEESSSLDIIWKKADEAMYEDKVQMKKTEME